MSEFDAVRSKLASIDKARLRDARLAHAAARRRFVRATETGDESEKRRAVIAMKQHRTSAQRIAQRGDV